MKGRVTSLGYKRSSTGKSWKYGAEIMVDLGWRKEPEDVEEEINKLKDKILGKDVMIVVLDE